MSRQTPSKTGQPSDWPSSKQTDKPWKGIPEKEQAPPDANPDLEKWNDSNTH
jgi:hypothetical protein